MTPSLKDLVQPCPICSRICPVFDQLLDLLRQSEEYVELVAMPRQDGAPLQLRNGTVVLRCSECNNNREVLTMLGQQIARLLPKELLAKPTKDRDEIPF